MMLQETGARIAAELRRRFDAGQCVDYRLDDISALVLYGDEGPFLHLAIPFSDGSTLEIDSRAGVYGFRLKDWSDFSATNELVTTGTGAEQTVQLAKLYEFGVQNVSRPIRKPVSGTVSLTADNAPLAATINYTTGMATFTAGLGDIVRWSGQFDVPVMFEQDELLFEAANRGVDGLRLTADVSLIEDISA